MPDPLPEDVVQRIRELAAAGTARNEIARQVGCSPATVTRYAPAGSFDRSSTAAAVQAHKIDAAAVRAKLALDLLSDAARLREQIWQPAKIYNFGGKDNTYNDKDVDEPPADVKRTLMLAANTALTAHLRLVDHDSDGGTEQAKGVLEKFMDAVAERAHELGAE
jgi:IS30 family transposase